MLSGDENAVLMTGSESPTLRLDELNAGTYVFELLVIDSLGQSDTDIVEVTVTGYMHILLHLLFFLKVINFILIFKPITINFAFCFKVY